jgi:hypothetical protein
VHPAGSQQAPVNTVMNEDDSIRDTAPCILVEVDRRFSRFALPSEGAEVRTFDTPCSLV